MDTPSRNKQEGAGPGSGGLTIGQLADRTGVAVATLRAWETRHGFLSPARRRTGHRRYAEDAVRLVREVVARRDSGVRLDVAIAQATAPDPAHQVARTSLYARLTRRHPTVLVQRLRKRTLLGMSWAIEDELLANADTGHVFGTFEAARNYEAARSRWDRLAEVADSVHVFADFPAPTTSSRSGRLTQVALPAGAPMLREWAVVCDGVELPIALTAWETPGQERTPDADRIFESAWTIDPNAVRDAARTCAGVAAAAGSTRARRLLAEDLGGPVHPEAADLVSLSRLVSRVVGYVDDAAGG